MAAAGLAVYIALVFAMTAAEKGLPGAGIRSPWDAAWYTITTLTTVGYGDYVPVSLPGRMIGAVLMVLSMGLWAALIGTIWSLVRGVLLPFRRVARISRKPWYVFSERNEAAESLARDLFGSDTGSRVIFCDDGENRNRNGMPRCVSVPQDILTLMLHGPARRAERTVFLTGQDGWANAALAQRLLPFCGSVYSRGKEAAQVEGVRAFDEASLCARRFWHEHPAGQNESVFLICGDGELARELLNHGLLACCRQPFHTTVFHVFGDWAAYRHMHAELGAVLAINALDSGKDSVIFHEEAWNADRSLLESADRILFAADDRRMNAVTAAELTQAFPVRGALFAATGLPVAGVVRFGDTESLYTAEMVMHQAMDRQACALHRAYCERTGGTVSWQELSPFLQDSNRAAADHLLTKIRLLLSDDQVTHADGEACRRAAKCFAALTPDQREDCRRNEHMRWWVFHALYNWRWAPDRDDALRLHPCMVPYEQLSAEERAKDDGAWEMIDAIAREEIT